MRTLVAYQQLAKKLPNIVFVDGAGTEEEVAVRVRNVVEKKLLP